MLISGRGGFVWAVPFQIRAWHIGAGWFLWLTEHRVRLCASLWLKHKGFRLVSAWGCWSCTDTLPVPRLSENHLTWKSKAVPELKVKLASPAFAWALRSGLGERVRTRVQDAVASSPALTFIFLQRFSVVQTSVPPRLVNTSSGCIDVCDVLLIIKVSHAPCPSPQEHHLTLKSYVVPPPSSTSKHRDPGSIKQPKNINSSHRD